MPRRGFAPASRVLLAVVAAGTFATTVPAHATQKFGPVELSGNLQAQNIVRHPDVDDDHFVEQRHSFRARVDWQWFAAGKLLDRFELPFVDAAKLFLLYR